MPLTLALRPRDELLVRANDDGWELVRGLDRLAELTISSQHGTRLAVCGEARTWTIAGALVPLALTLWDEGSGEGAAWCSGHTIGLGATVQVAGAEQDLTFHTGMLGGARLTADDGPVATLSTKGRDTRFEVSLVLADRPDLESLAGGVALVAAWRMMLGLMPFTGNPGSVGP